MAATILEHLHKEVMTSEFFADIKSFLLTLTVCGYCKFGNFCEDFIFVKLRICEVS